MSEPTELRRLLREGTPGPWEVDGDFLVTRSMECAHYDTTCIADLRYFHMPDNEANAALITAAVNALPGLLDRVEALEKALDLAAWRFDFLGNQMARHADLAGLKPTFDEAAADARALSPSMKVER